MALENTPIFRDLDETQRALLYEQAVKCHIKPGEMLFREGDPAQTAYVLVWGRCMLSQAMQPLREAERGELLDSTAALGDLSHTLTAIGMNDCDVLCWPMDTLWQFAPFAAAARRHMASALLETRARLDELQTPVHYIGSAEISPGPFVFEGLTMVVALCDADLSAVEAVLPEGLSLLRRPGLRRGPVFLALAKFPTAYPEHQPNQRFAYDETTCFVPVRSGASIGLYVPYIYPSTWEPILLGREIYGFPKRLGKTTFTPNSVELAVDGLPNLRLTWHDTKPTREPRLVRALSSWVGVEGRATELAFRAGEMLRQTLGLPAYRRVDVYNHKRFLAADATAETPTYAVNCLTRAVFGVRRWHEIARMNQPELAVVGGPLQQAGLSLREAYYTRLDMRLSTGQVVRAYS